MAFCQRIREIAKKSIIQKLEILKTIPQAHKKSFALAAELLDKFENCICEGRAVDAFAHLLVNYIYRFFCIRDRVAIYSDRLRELPSKETLFDRDSVGLMQDCARNLENPDDDFLNRLEAEKLHRDEWLQTLTELSTFVGEIVKFTRNTRMDRPRLFVTYHFDVEDSERFVNLLTDGVWKKNMNVEIVRGRHLGRDIRWSILARIWMCDHHILFVPRSWMRKNLSPDWKPRTNRCGTTGARQIAR